MKTQNLQLTKSAKNGGLRVELIENHVCRVLDDSGVHLDDYGKQDIFDFLEGVFRIKDSKGFAWDCGDGDIEKASVSEVQEFFR